MTETFTTISEPISIESTNATGGGIEESVFDSKVERPLSIMEVPYSVEFFNLKDFKELNDFTDTHNIREGVSKLEKFVMDQITNNNLTETSSSYEEIIKEIFNKLNISDNETNISKFLKVVQYIGMFGRNRSIDDRKKELLERAKNKIKEQEEVKNRRLKTRLTNVKREKDEAEQEKNRMTNVISKMERENKEALGELDKFKDKINVLIEAKKNEQVRREKDRSEFVKRIEYLESKLEKQTQQEIVYETSMQRFENDKANNEREINKLEKQLRDAEKRENNIKLKQEKFKKLINQYAK